MNLEYGGGLHFKGYLSSSDALTISRERTGPLCFIRWYVIEFNDNVTVQHGNVVLDSNYTGSDKRIYPNTVDKSKSILYTIIRAVQIQTIQKIILY